MSISHDQMEPHPLPEDIGLRQLDGPGHGAGSMGRPPRRGILVTVRRLKHQGVNLSPDERKRAQAVIGELKIRQVNERRSEYRSIAEVLDFDDSDSQHLRYFPSRLLVLLNPEILWVDERGMLVYGIERVGGIGSAMVSYWQTWQVVFGVAQPVPPF